MTLLFFFTRVDIQAVLDPRIVHLVYSLLFRKLRQAASRDERQKETVIRTEGERETHRNRGERVRERDAERGRKEETEWPSGSNLLLAYKNTLMTVGHCMRCMYVCVFNTIFVCVCLCPYAPPQS